jgi:hypothetical protein
MGATDPRNPAHSLRASLRTPQVADRAVGRRVAPCQGLPRAIGDPPPRIGDPGRCRDGPVAVNGWCLRTVDRLRRLEHRWRLGPNGRSTAMSDVDRMRVGERWAGCWLTSTPRCRATLAAAWPASKGSRRDRGRRRRRRPTQPRTGPRGDATSPNRSTPRGVGLNLDSGPVSDPGPTGHPAPPAQEHLISTSMRSGPCGLRRPQ